MQKYFRGLASILLGLSLLCLPPSAHAAQSKKPASSKAAPRSKVIARDPYLGAVIMDAASGKILFEANADAKGYPASMLKIMDLLIILERVKQGQLSLTEPVTVSAKASRTGGSQVYLAEKEVFTVDELLYALMVQSANDAAVALAERVGGTTEGFVQMMNQKAQELGMHGTVFNSVHGLPPGAGQQHDVTTARDFAILSRELIREYPDALRYTSTRERSFRSNIPEKTIVMRTHNHLLAGVPGCDGLKTGYITAAGFSVAVTAERQGRRVIVVVLDSTTSKVRDQHARELVEKGFNSLPAATPTPAASAVPAKPARK